MYIDDEPVEEGLPAYMGTFADLMALLMIFFVLLFSFSELDAMKFKMVAKSMEHAFGVQRSIPLPDIPMGTSVIAEHYSPGTPSPTLLRVMRQETTDDTQRFLQTCNSLEQARTLVNRDRMAQLKKDAAQLKRDLQHEINAGLITIDVLKDRIVIRIQEKGSFESGDAKLNASFLPVISKISHTINKSDGKLVVSGHTDTIPINTPRFPSNWELSTARSTSVVRAMLDSDVDSQRMAVEGYADTQPLADNNTVAGRAKNRRVEINIM